ncbi:N,N-dimethylformamidase beta subunit family domain-containing protein [Acidisphaera sp. L21]|uniref:N,N-dimethylformamidase beta subunit family domain-containing protein n=1 Tax=Acidisphaera sp. L21 TaxID=1641851 RepID=UPI00131E258E|nr:N,N-dimethylformamidase beta subunit family domain-containing protein [Acidisphaera sp. L21]
MYSVAGYCDRWSVKPGQAIRFMVSSTDDAPISLRFLRHLCADPNPNGPGLRNVVMPSPLDGTHPAQFQPAWLGSYGVAQRAVTPGATLGLGVTIWPTAPEAGMQSLVTLSGTGWQLVLGIDAAGAFAEIDGTRVSVAAPMLDRRWYDIALTIDATGSLHLSQRPRDPVPLAHETGIASATVQTLPAGACQVMVAAMPGETSPATANYNGKLERPTIWRNRTVDAVLNAQRDAIPAIAADLVACWDFSIGIDGYQATDIGPDAAHATLVALPTRAMTGANWTGEVHDWKHAPEQYGAIHFHDDDQGDLGWAPSFELSVPADWPSGFYSAEISKAGAVDHIPFFVRPTAARAALAVLVPTFTYQVYGCYVRPGRGTEIAERVAAWGALAQTPDMNRQFGLSSYNYHSDGSGVAITSMARPMLDTRPVQMSLMDPSPNGSGTGRICSDSYIVDWLDRAGIPFDVVTDHDLHEEGVALLQPYRAVIATQHPEYHSDRMMQALEDFQDLGGRFMYLGGNGFYWRAEPSAAAPHALEIRRAEGGIRVWATEAGESYQAHGGGYGGLWRRIGRPSHRLVGIGFSVQGRHLGFPYHFTGGITDPRVAFMLDGLDVAPGQVFGDAGFMGGGASGFELDSADVRYGTPPHALIVAKGIVIHPDYLPVNEDMLVIRHPRPHEDWSCADMVFFETKAGGAVFSVGSMTYVGSLPVNGYDNTLTRLTTNVLRRFLDPAPFV